MEDMLVEPLVRYRETGAWRIEAAAATRQGDKRATNEDTVFCRSGQVEAGKWAGLFMVCDGLGGHEAGEIASRLAIETVSSELAGLVPPEAGLPTRQRTRPSDVVVDECIRWAILRANAKIHEFARQHQSGAGNLGTTLTLALLDGQTAHIANVGDSRTYVSHGGQVTQITEDHSMAAKLAEAGIHTGDGDGAPPRNIIYRALGIDDTVEADLFRWHVEPGDKLLLCSDGLWQAFPEAAELARWLGPDTAPDDLCKQLVAEAHRRDGSDDTSAVVVAIR